MRDRERHQGVEHLAEMPLHRARGRRVRIFVRVVVSARDHRRRDALYVRAQRREVLRRIAALKGQLLSGELFRGEG